MLDDVDLNEVEKRLKKLAPRTRVAKLRPLFPLIQERIDDGVPAKKIVSELEAVGISISVQSLYDALAKWRKRHAQSPAPKSGVAKTPVQTPAVVPPSPSPSPTTTPTQPVSTKGDLRKLRHQHIDLDEYARLGRTLKEK